MEKKISLIPLFSIFILIVALIKVYVFYNNFNIPIKFFIDISELTVIVFEDLLFLVPPLTILYFLTGKSNEEIDISKRFNELFGKRPRDTGKKEMFYNFLRKSIIALATLFTLLLLLGVPLYLILVDRTYSEKVFGFSMLTSIVFIAIIFTKNKLILAKIGVEGIIGILILFLFTFFFILRTLVEIEDVEKGKYLGTQIVTEEKTYISTPDSYYIGQTSSYVFIFNHHKNQSTIIPVSEIIRIELSIRK